MKKLFSLFCIFSFSIAAISQTTSDNALLKEVSFEKEEYQKRAVVYGFSENKKKNFNPIYHLFSSSMYVYQSVISPQLSTRCAYSPSCSAYSKDLIKRYGFLKGLFCTTDRLMRCNRIALADAPVLLFDPQDKKIHEDAERYCSQHKKKHKQSSKTVAE